MVKSIMIPTQAFILAGGRGERLRPLTEKIPKPMVLVQGMPILEHAINGLVEHGVKKIIIATGVMENKIREYFGSGGKFGVDITYSHENKPLGTGGALVKAKNLLGKKFFMLNGDNLSDINFTEMNEAHEKKNAVATIALIKVLEVSQYGVAKLEGNKIIEFVEKPMTETAPSNWANSGAYILEKQAIDMLPNGFSMIEKNLFPALAKKGALFAYMHTGQWFPTDTPEKYEKANKEWKNPQSKELKKQGLY
ncbi:MAG: nucleotidyltransferase family protein [archaeon]|nr:nucleotidyltransferase family protein [archaeon]